MAENKTPSPQEDIEEISENGPDASAPGTSAGAPGGESPREETDAPQTGSDGETPEEAIARLEAKAAELKDQLLRALAETENVRRRAQRDREDAARYAAAPLLKDLIEVADNLRRAIEAVPAEAIAEDPHLRTLITGIEMTEKALHGVFEKHHVTRIDPMGERLDPHQHEAMYEIPDSSQPPGTVLQVVRAGYRLHDRLLRPAQVGVAKGGRAPAKGGRDSDEGKTPGSQVDTTA